MRIKCSDPECESHESNGMFEINVTVDIDREIAENLNKISPAYFSCTYCGAKAIDDVVEVNDAVG